MKQLVRLKKSKWQHNQWSSEQQQKMFEQRSEFGEIHTWMEDEQIRSYLISNILWCNRQSHPNDVLDRNKDCALRWCSRQHTHTRSNTAIWRWFIRLWAEHWFWIHSISKNGCRLAMASPLSTFHLFQHSGPIFFFFCIWRNSKCYTKSKLHNTNMRLT